MISKRALLVAAALAGAVGACATDTIDTASEDALSGKADEPAAIAVAEANETLWSRSLRSSLCRGIASTADFDTVTDRVLFEEGCQGHDFTITERRTSTLYAHQDDLAPLTMGMTVTVSDGRSEYVADLDRRWQADSYRFAWEVTAPEGRTDRDEYIRDLADEMGEYFDGWGDERFGYVTLSEVPAEILAVAQQRADDTTTRWQEDRPGSTDSAGVYDEAFRIFDADGAVVGYVIQVHYNIDDTLFDGGGETLYFDLAGRVVADVEWWG